MDKQKKKIGKISTVFADTEIQRMSFIDIAESHEQEHWDKGAFLLTHAPNVGFKIGAEVFEMEIKYNTQVRKQIRKDMYEVTPGETKHCKIQDWLKNETINYFGKNCTSEELAKHFWDKLMPSANFNNINYSNGNSKTLFPGKLWNWNMLGL